MTLSLLLTILQQLYDDKTAKQMNIKIINQLYKIQPLVLELKPNITIIELNGEKSDWPPEKKLQ